MIHQLKTASRGTPSILGFSAVTAVAAVIAAVASGASLALALPVWAMFIGWVAFFRGAAADPENNSRRAALHNCY
jgi:hypothetical protein